MSDITIRQPHTLGLPKARELAHQWVAQASKDLGLLCKYQESVEFDTIAFERMGVTGTILVKANSMDLDIELGMMKPLKGMVQGIVTQNLSAMIEKASGFQA